MAKKLVFNPFTSTFDYVDDTDVSAIWGSITGVLSDQTDLQLILDALQSDIDTKVQSVTGLNTDNTDPLKPIVQISVDGITVTGSGTPGDPLVSVPGGSYVDIIDITYANMTTAIAGSTLTKGQFYRITDATGTDLGMIVQAVRTNEITVHGVGGYLNTDWFGTGDYSGVAAETGIPAGSFQGIWSQTKEAITITYDNLTYDPDEVQYTTSTGQLQDGETFVANLGNTGTVVHDDGVGTVTFYLDTPATLPIGTTLVGDINGYVITIDNHNESNKEFQLGEELTDTITGATAQVISSDPLTNTIIAYITSAGLTFDDNDHFLGEDGKEADVNGTPTPALLVTGDIVLYNGLLYQITDDTLFDGTDPLTNTSAYVVLTKSVVTGYTETWDKSEYDFTNDWVQYREDTLGNKIRYTKAFDASWFGLGYSAISDFSWGLSYWIGNVSDNGYINDLNNIYHLENNTLGAKSTLGSNFLTDTSYIYENVLKNDASIEYNACYLGTLNINNNYIENGGINSNSKYTGNDNASSIIYNNLFGESYIVGNSLGNVSSIQDNVLFSDAYISGLGLESSDVSRNFLQTDAILENVYGTDIYIAYNTFESSAVVSTIETDNLLLVSNNFGANSNFSEVIVTNGTLSFSRNTFESGASFRTVEAVESIDIEDNTFGQNCSVEELYLGTSVQIFGNDCKAGSEIFSLTTGDNTTFSYNTFGIQAFLSTVVCSGGGTIQYNNLESGASFSAITMADSSISYNNLGIDAIFGTLTLDANSRLEYNNLAVSSYIQDSTLGVDCGITRNVLLSGALIRVIMSGIGAEISQNLLQIDSGILDIYSMGDYSSIDNNMVGLSCSIFELDMADNSAISYNILESGATISTTSTMGSYAVVQYNTFNASALYNFVMDVASSIINNQVNTGSEMGNLIMGEQAGIAGNILDGYCNFLNIEMEDATFINYNHLEIYGVIDTIYLTAGSYIEGNIFGTVSTFGTTFSDKTLDTGISFSQNRLYVSSTATETYSANIENKRAETGFSNFEATIDITSLTTLDCTADYNYVGIFNLTSTNATETLDTITNFPTLFPYTLYPASGLEVTLTGTAVASAGAGDIILPTTVLVIEGTNGDWGQFEADRGGVGYSVQKDAMNFI